MERAVQGRDGIYEPNIRGVEMSLWVPPSVWKLPGPGRDNQFKTYFLMWEPVTLDLNAN